MDASHQRKCNKRLQIFALNQGHHSVIYFLALLESNKVMHVAAIFITGFLDIIEALFAIGLVGSVLVLFLTFIEDIKTVFS
jgi:energy-converting hydrogenase Eha subunit C